MCRWSCRIRRILCSLGLLRAWRRVRWACTCPGLLFRGPVLSSRGGACRLAGGGRGAWWIGGGRRTSWTVRGGLGRVGSGQVSIGVSVCLFVCLLGHPPRSCSCLLACVGCKMIDQWLTHSKHSSTLSALTPWFVRYTNPVFWNASSIAKAARSFSSSLPCGKALKSTMGIAFIATLVR
jgi:hypothetical protein